MKIPFQQAILIGIEGVLSSCIKHLNGVSNHIQVVGTCHSLSKTRRMRSPRLLTCHPYFLRLKNLVWFMTEISEDLDKPNAPLTPFDCSTQSRYLLSKGRLARRKKT